MVWLRLEDNMLDHPKWRRALRIGGDETVTVWFRIVSWCSRNLTDGVVPADMVCQVAEVRSDARSRPLRALADAGLITRSDDGQVTVTDYLQRNPSKSDVLKARESATQRKQKHRLVPPVTHESQRGTLTLERPAATPQSPSHPNPLPIPPQEEEEARALEVSKPRHPGPLKQTARDFAAADPTGGAPVPKFNWDPDWVPTTEHQAVGFENGLTDEDIADELDDCRRKLFTRGFKSEDDQFFRELKWAGDEKRLKKAREARSGANWEKPGHQRQSRG